MKMKLLSLTILIIILTTSCNNPDLKGIFLKNQSLFKKIENPRKVNKRYDFGKKDEVTSHPAFDSTQLESLKRIFDQTSLNQIYVIDGDVFVKNERSIVSLYFTKKQPSNTIALSNFTGSLEYLLKNGETETPPYAMKIDSNWYILHDIESL